MADDQYQPALELLDLILEIQDLAPTYILWAECKNQLSMYIEAA